MAEISRLLRSGKAIRKWFIDPIARNLLSIAFQIRVTGATPSGEGASIWACNHSSHFEPLIACACARTPLHALAMEELFRTRLRRFFFTLTLAIPVDRRNGDSRALREAIRRLQTGHEILVFPEGGIRVGNESLALRTQPLIPGAAFLAVLTGTPIIPVMITNGRQGYQWQIWRGRRFRSSVYFGLAISPATLPDESRKEAISRINQELLIEMQALLKDAQQGNTH